MIATCRLVSNLFLAVTIMVSIQVVYAQDQAKAGFAVNVETQSYSGRPGGTVTGDISIVTTGTTEVTRFDLKLLDLDQSPEGTVQPADIGQGTRSCASWIKIAERVEMFAGGGTRRVPFTISIPSKAEGTYYAFIGVSMVPEKPDEPQTAVLIRPSLMARLELEIVGQQAISIDVLSVSFEHDLGNGNPGIRLKLINNGTTKTTFEGDVLLYGPSRRSPYRLEIPSDAQGKPQVVYPNTNRVVRCRVDEIPRPGKYRAEVRLRMGGRWRARSTFEIEVPPRGSAVSLATRPEWKAECDVDVEIKPKYIEVSLPSGATRLSTIAVYNRDSLPVNLLASVVAVEQERNGFYTYSEINDTSARWVQVTPSELALSPRSSGNLVLRIRAPELDEQANPVCAVRISGNAGLDGTGWVSEVDEGVPIIAVSAGADQASLDISRLEVIRQGEENNATAAILALKNVGGRTAQLHGSLFLERAGSKERILTMSVSEAEGFEF